MWLCFRPHNFLYFPEGKTKVILESSQLLSWGGLGVGGEDRGVNLTESSSPVG